MDRSVALAHSDPRPADTVVVRFPDGEFASFRVIDAGARPGAGEMSTEAPLFRALRHARVGDRVRVEGPRGPFEVEFVGLVREAW